MFSTLYNPYATIFYSNESLYQFMKYSTSPIEVLYFIYRTTVLHDTKLHALSIASCFSERLKHGYIYENVNAYIQISIKKTIFVSVLSSSFT